MSIARGKLSPTENYEEIAFSPQSGVIRRAGVGGPKEAVRPLINELIAAGRSFTYVCDQSPVATIRYETPGLSDPTNPPSAETPTLVWEYFAGRVEIDVLEADLNGTNGRADVNGISVTDKERIRKAINTPDSATSPVFTDPDATDLYRLMLDGVRSFRVFTPTLKRSMLVSGSYAVQASLANVGRIFTSATLQTVELVPNSLFYPAITSLPAANKSGRVAGWYKNFPGTQQAGGNKWNVSQEWEYGLWAVKLYGTAL